MEGEHILVLGLNLHDWYCSCIGLIFFTKKFAGFSPVWVSQDKIFVSLVHGYLSVILIFISTANELCYNCGMK